MGQQQTGQQTKPRVKQRVELRVKLLVRLIAPLRDRLPAQLRVKQPTPLLAGQRGRQCVQLRSRGLGGLPLAKCGNGASHLLFQILTLEGSLLIGLLLSRLNL